MFGNFFDKKNSLKIWYFHYEMIPFRTCFLVSFEKPYLWLSFWKSISPDSNRAKVSFLRLKYTAKSVAKIASWTVLITRLNSSWETLERIWLPLEFKIIKHWSKWWCSMVEVEYNWAKFELDFVWKELLVPRWSKSWHRHAMTKDRHSTWKNTSFKKSC